MVFQGGAVVAARPESFLLFIILIPVFFVMVRRYRRGRKDLNAIGGKWRSRLLMDVFQIKWFFSSLVFILFIIFSILSLAEFTGRGKTTVESSPVLILYLQLIYPEVCLVRIFPLQD